MFARIKKRIETEKFEPGILGLITNPFYFARRGLFVNLVPLLDQVGGATLDVGCGQKPYEKYCCSIRYVGLEIDSLENRQNKKADYFYDGNIFPFNDVEFDSIVTHQVFEHVFSPEKFLKEIYRVLKPNGLFLISVPFVWDEHEQPYDYARYSSFGLTHLLEKNGFEILQQRKSCNDLTILFQLLNAYIYKKLYLKSSLLRTCLTVLLTSIVNLMGALISKLFPKNDDLYLDNIVLARKK